MNILGLNAFHGDSSAALIRDGQLVAAAEEERFCRIKHWAGLPVRSIAFCLEQGGTDLSDIDVIAINQDSRANSLEKLKFAMKHWPRPGFIYDKIKDKLKRQGIIAVINSNFPGKEFNGKLMNVEHHLAHLSSTFHVSSFPEALAVSVDGFGDFASCAWGIGRGNDIRVDGRIYFPHSLGFFYLAMTQFLGFPYYGDEYKVMGLAPYGKARYMDAMHRIVKLQDDGSFRLDLEYFKYVNHKIEYQWTGSSPKVSTLLSDRITGLLGEARQENEPLMERHRDIACSVQMMYEEAFFHLLNSLERNCRTKNLALSGGCAMNSVANGKICRMTGFKKIYIAAAPGDAGGAIGAALVAWYAINAGVDARPVMNHAYWGPEYTNEKISNLLRERMQQLADADCTVELISDLKSLCQKTAAAIAAGKVVGWFQGRMEWGPRALGNRSIVCDPGRTDMKELLNRKIKRRESFRPFAPSILREAVSQWFEEDDDVPFMSQVFQIRPERRHQIPAVAHVDGSGRLQTVTRESNARYYELIRAFNDITGIPIVLNTSFNENEPIVCSPEEALECFIRTDMDTLVMNDYSISRNR